MEEFDDQAERRDHLRERDDRRPGIGQVHEIAAQPSVAPPGRSAAAALRHALDMGRSGCTCAMYRKVFEEGDRGSSIGSADAQSRADDRKQYSQRRTHLE